MFANSRDVANCFEKGHNDVLKDIRRIMDQTEGVGESSQTPWFNRVYVMNEQNGQFYPTWDMTKDGFTLLVMGYTGQKAMQFKLRYIQRFNEMELALKQQAQAPATSCVIPPLLLPRPIQIGIGSP